MPGIVSSQIQDGPPVKRQKLNASTVENSHLRGVRKPKIFAPFRTVGLISPTAVPFTTLPLGKTTFQITTSVGRCLQTYDLRRGLQLVFLTRPQTPDDITATTSWNDRVFAAWGQAGKHAARGVWVFRRGKKTDEFEVPPDFEEPIKQLLVLGTWIVGCCSTKVEVWKAANYEHYTTLISPLGKAASDGSVISGGIVSMATYLNKIFVGRQDGTVEIWNLSTGKLIYTIIPTSSKYGSVTALEPAPALSLLAIAYSDGSVIIHDVRVDREILKFSCGSYMQSPVSSISFRTDGLGAGEDGQKPGVMATASRGSGDVTFWDLNSGSRRMGVLRSAHNLSSTGNREIPGGITKIEFLPGQGVLLTTGLDNSLKSWIFDETPFSPVPRILHSRGGHSAPVTNLQFLPSDADGVEAGGKWLMSGSKDRSFWGWSLRRDGQSTELSQGNIRKKAKKAGLLSSHLHSTEPTQRLEELKAPEITCMACSLNRDGGMGAMPGVSAIWTRAGKGKAKGNTGETNMTGWESVITGHKGDKLARTWFWGRKRAGRWAFETGDASDVTSVAISPCGTFALVGSSSGGIDMFNLQSGQHRQRFPARLTPTQAKNVSIRTSNAAVRSSELDRKPCGPGQGKHKKAVTGLEVDSLNRTVISCSEDGKIKFWDFSTGLLVHEIDWSPIAAITKMKYHRPSDLIALSCDDNAIRVTDIETKKLVRELRASGGAFTDFCFSSDGRWIVAASTDSIIRVWDLPTAHLIEAVRLPSQCTALAFSNTGEFLATAQADSVGISLWTNRTLFTHVPTRHLSEDDIADIDAPTASGEGGQGVIDSALEVDDEEADAETAPETAIPSLEQLSKEIQTLSIVPRSRWQNLLHLDAIKARNKPAKPPTAPEKAPFFLPSLHNASNAAVATSQHSSKTTEATTSRISTLSHPSKSSSQFTDLLLQSHSSGTYAAFVEHLKTLSPAEADLQIRSLSPAHPYAELVAFVKAVTQRLEERRDYELCQAWMAVWLRLHGDVLIAGADGNAENEDGDEDGDEDEEGGTAGVRRSREGLREAVAEWRRVQQREGKRVGNLVGYCQGVVAFLRSGR